MNFLCYWFNWVLLFTAAQEAEQFKIARSKRKKKFALTCARSRLHFLSKGHKGYFYTQSTVEHVFKKRQNTFPIQVLLV